MSGHGEEMLKKNGIQHQEENVSDNPNAILPRPCMSELLFTIFRGWDFRQGSKNKFNVFTHSKREIGRGPQVPELSCSGTRHN